jgi:RNA polymerase sigma factor (sigma-70 family)
MSHPVEAAWGSIRRTTAARTPTQTFEAYRRNPNHRLKAQLVQANMGLVEKSARRWQHQCESEPYEDLRQEGVFGLLKAIERYDPATGYAFSSFAMPYISGAIQHYLRDKGWGQVRPPRQAVEQYSKVKGAQRRLTAMGRELPDHEVAEGLGIPAARWQFVKQAREQPRPLSLDDSPLEIEASAPMEVPQSQVIEHLIDLPLEQYECVVESVFAGLRDDEIAARKHCTTAEVRACVAAGLGTLRAKILEGSSRVG